MKRLLIVLSILLALPSFGQNVPRVDEKIDVELVLLDVTVTDQKGNQILGLSPSDFVVKEEGVEQQVTSADYFTNRRLLNMPEDKAPFNVERVREERYFVFFFHRLEDPSAYRAFYNDLMAAKRSVEQFLDSEMQPQDKVAIAGYDFRLKLYGDFTSNKEKIRKALNEAITFSLGIKDSGSASGSDSIVRNIDMKRVINKTGRVYDGIRVLAEALRPIAARKVMVLFSPGIGDISSFNSEILDNEDQYYKPMAEALNRANVTVYPVQLLRDSDFHATEQTLSRIADETGGEYFRQAINFDVPLRKIENQSNGYYLIGYYTKKRGSDFKRVEVSLKTPEFRVRTRKGYGD